MQIAEAFMLVAGANPENQGTQTFATQYLVELCWPASIHIIVAVAARLL